MLLAKQKGYAGVTKEKGVPSYRITIEINRFVSGQCMHSSQSKEHVRHAYEGQTIVLAYRRDA